jgi:hypothetical protein
MRDGKPREPAMKEHFSDVLGVRKSIEINQLLIEAIGEIALK